MEASHRGLSLRDRIFPLTAAHDLYLVRLGLVESWESQFVGLTRLTEFLTQGLLQRSHAVDDMALSLVFLQRHRVEVGLKLILERVGELADGAGKLVNTHNLLGLFESAKRGCANRGRHAGWQSSMNAQREFVALMQEVDPKASTFRYPVDTAASPWRRGEFVDLRSLQAEGSIFAEGVSTLVRHLLTLEPLPASDDHPALAYRLAELAQGCTRVVDAQRYTLDAIRRVNDDLGAALSRPVHRDGGAAVEMAGEAVQDVAIALAQRAHDFARRISDERGLTLSLKPAAALAAPPPAPVPFDPQARTKILELERFVVDTMLDAFAPLKRSLPYVCDASKGWTTPAARQLHLDAERFRERLFRKPASQA